MGFAEVNDEIVQTMVFSPTVFIPLCEVIIKCVATDVGRNEPLLINIFIREGVDVTVSLFDKNWVCASDAKDILFN